MTDANTEYIHSCLSARGTSPGCADCHLNKKNLCEQMVTTMGKFHGKMIKNMNWLTWDDREDILQEGVIAIFKDIDKLKQNNAFQGWAWHIFANKRDDLLRKRGRADRLAIQVHKPPINMAELSETYIEYISWSSDIKKITLQSNRLPHKIYKRLLAEALFPTNDQGAELDAEKDWKNHISRLYRYSCQPIFTGLEIIDTKESTPSKVNPKYDNEMESEILSLFTSIKSKQSKKCTDLFRQLLEHDNDRKKLAAQHDQTEDAIKKQISRCYQLFRKKILDILRTVSTDQGRFCYSLLSDLFQNSSNLQKRITTLAQQTGVVSDDIARQIRRCRILALRILGENYA